MKIRPVKVKIEEDCTVTIYNKKIPRITYIAISTTCQDGSKINWDRKFFKNGDASFYKGKDINEGEHPSKNYLGLREIDNETLNRILDGKTFLYCKIHEEEYHYPVDKAEIKKLQEIYESNWLEIHIHFKEKEFHEARTFIQKYAGEKINPTQKEGRFPIIARIRSGDKLAGIAYLSLPKEHNGNGILEFIAVGEEHRGKGIGQRLLNEVIAQFKRARVAKAEMLVSVNDELGLGDFLLKHRWSQEQKALSRPEQFNYYRINLE